MALECEKCNTKITDKEYLKCLGCKKQYHLDCCSVSDKRFRLMTKEHKTNWECRLCIVKKNKPFSNITQRKPQPPVSPSEISMPDLYESSDTLVDETLNRSCPENCSHIREDIEDLKTKILYLETKLESADSEIERLLAENYSLKEIMSKRDAKINQLTRICKSTSPRSETRPHGDSAKKYKLRNKPLDQLDCSSPILTNQSSTQKSVKNTEETPIPTLCLPKGQIQTAQQTQTAQIHTGYLRTENLISPPRAAESISKNDKTRATKICLISTNKQNKTSLIARATFQGNYDICHYLLPNRGIKQLLHGIESKVANFSINDYCIVMIGDEDFSHTENYHELVLHIRQALINIKHTTVLICIPTFKQGINTEMFNSRIESFNFLLDKDVIAHEYAYLVDSNLNLNYDNTMFHRLSGTLNNRGLKQVFRDVNQRINIINDWLIKTDIEKTALRHLKSSDHTYKDNTNTFFRC